MVRKCVDTTCPFHSKIFVDICNIGDGEVRLFTYEKDCPYKIVERHSKSKLGEK